jgi:hypothetical protein
LQKDQLHDHVLVSQTTLLHICRRFSKCGFHDPKHGPLTIRLCSFLRLNPSKYPRLTLYLCAIPRHKFHRSSMCIHPFHVLCYLETSLGRLNHY